MSQVVVAMNSLDWEFIVEEQRDQFNVINGGRRIHKTDNCIKTLITRTLKRPPGSLGVYLNRSRIQAKSVAWKRTLAYFSKPNDWLLAGQPNVNELTIPMIGDRMIQLIGCEEIDSQRGIGPAIACFDEVAHNRYAEAMWKEVIGPALTDKEGEAYFYSSPKGRTFFYRMFMRGQAGPLKRKGWKSWTFTSEEVGTIPEWELEEKRQENEDTYKQEFLAEFLGYVGLAVNEFIPRLYPEGNIISMADWERVKKRFIAIGGIDFAKSSGSTARIIYGVDDTKRLIAVNEMMLMGGNPTRLAGKINTTDASLWSRPLYNVMGRDSFAKESHGQSPAEQLGLHGVSVVRCPYLLEDAIAKLNDLCLPRKGEGDDAMPGFMVLSGACPQLVAQLSTIQSEDLEKKTQHRKDALDTARMVAMMGTQATMRTKPEDVVRFEQKLDMSGYDDEERYETHPISGRPLD